MKKTKKHIWLAIIAIIIAGLAFGYAYLTTTLSINGITDIDRNSWDVYFDNVQVTDGSVSGAQEIEAPTITSDTEVEFHVNLKKPGDFYEFTIEARNDGTIDAMINSVSKKLNGTEITTLPSYLNYTVTYEDDIEIQDNHLLAAESLETYKVRVEYKSNISASDLPSSAQSLTLSFGVEYVQSDENAKSVRTIMYSSSRKTAVIGEPLPDEVTVYDNPEDAINEFGYNVLFKHIIVNNNIRESYLGVMINDNLIYFQGGDNGLSYTNNKTKINNIIGADKCSEAIIGDKKTYNCNYNNSGKTEIFTIESNGYIYASNGSGGCSIDANGSLNCYYSM